MDVRAWLETSRAWAEAQLEDALSRLELGPERHAEAIRYALMGGGKRLRPSLVRMVALELGGDEAAAGAPAAAIEMIHTYSLVHDDLPCMDDDDLRRGRPTTHKVYGEAEGVLVGDALQALAFEHLARHGGPRAAEQVAVLAQASGPGGMVGGQSLDLAATGTLPETGAVRQIHALKTAALIAAAAELGAIAAGADGEARRWSREYGVALGRLFQAVDDILDVTADTAALGKTAGKDAEADKATLVATLGLAGARAEAESLAESARTATRQAGLDSAGPALALVDWVLHRGS